MPWGTLVFADQLAPFNLIADYQKPAREVSSDALRDRIWGLCLAMKSECGPYGAVDVQLRLIKV